MRSSTSWCELSVIAIDGALECRLVQFELDILLTPSRKLMGVRNNHQLDLESQKMSKRRPLGEDICDLIMGGDELDEDVSIKYFLTNEVIVNLNMSGTCMKDRV
jgi:hypothetical protein